MTGWTGTISEVAERVWRAATPNHAMAVGGGHAMADDQSNNSSMKARKVTPEAKAARAAKERERYRQLSAEQRRHLQDLQNARRKAHGRGKTAAATRAANIERERALQRERERVRYHSNIAAGRKRSRDNYYRRRANPDGLAKIRAARRRAGPSIKRHAALLARCERDGRRRAAAQGAPVERLNYADILMESCGYCGICGKRFERDQVIGFDHIVPFALGGGHVAGNVHAVHDDCNTKKCRRLLQDVDMSKL